MYCSKFFGNELDGEWYEELDNEFRDEFLDEFRDDFLDEFRDDFLLLLRVLERGDDIYNIYIFLNSIIVYLSV